MKADDSVSAFFKSTMLAVKMQRRWRMCCDGLFSIRKCVCLQERSKKEKGKDRRERKLFLSLRKIARVNYILFPDHFPTKSNLYSPKGLDLYRIESSSSYVWSDAGAKKPRRHPPSSELTIEAERCGRRRNAKRRTA